MKAPKHRRTAKVEKAKSRKRKSLHGARDNGGPPWDWGNVEQKRTAFLKIMNAIIENPDLGKDYLNSNEKAAQAFRDAGMKVPDDVKVVFLPAGDSDKLASASAVIELPRVDPSKPKPTPDELAELFVANYHIVW
jgi:hypothetical protein